MQAVLLFIAALVFAAPPHVSPIADIPESHRSTTSYIARCKQGCVLNYRIDKTRGESWRGAYLRECIAFCDAGDAP